MVKAPTLITPNNSNHFIFADKIYDIDKVMTSHPVEGMN